MFGYCLLVVGNCITMRILNTIGTVFADEGKKLLATVGDVDYKIPPQKELLEIIGNYDAVIIGLGLNFTKEVIDAGNKLKVIATATTGLDHIDVEYAKKKGVEVLSLRGEDAFLNTISGTAELALGLMIDLVRKSPFAFESVKRNEWNRDAFRGITLQGKTLGIVGLGRLGSMMARYGKALGMKVLFVDPFKESTEYEKVSFEILLKESDAVSIHVHLLPETENMFNAKAFSKMKKTAVVINTARGKIVDEKAILKALEEGMIGGYAADVLSDELSFSKKDFKSDPLVEYAKTHDNCIIVPHIGGMTTDSRFATDVFMAEKLTKFLKK